ncbi:hypothetical protein [Lentzea sp. NBRC 105346]|uniref:hypothetical protein n=1 Tax=Lentzea sp. NBRC 105346 TaxID=3032205 RepID=UPI0025576B99|nr:hypothetical protein [Lentzea sp. NBRC 105346]
MIITAAAAIALSACTATVTSGEPPVATIAQPSVTTTTTTPPLSKEAAAKHYLAIVKPYNEALERLEQAINNGKPIDVQRGAATETLQANEEQIRQLKAALWPEDIRTAVDELVAESGKAQEFWRKASEAQTRDQVVEQVRAALKHDGTAAAKTIRERLELAKYDERDYGGS